MFIVIVMKFPSAAQCGTLTRLDRC